MKRILSVALSIFMATALAACNAAPSETADTEDNTEINTTAQTTTADSIAETAAPKEEAAAVDEAGFADEAVAEFANEAGGITTTAETTTATAKQEPAVCGTYRTVVPIDDVDPATISPEEEMFYYCYIIVDQMDDGHFQVQFRDPYGGSDESYAVFETEALGTSQITNFSFNDSDPIASSSAGGAVTITIDGDSAWVAYGDGEAEEYRKTE
jgi:hypothetical protein